MRQALRRLLAIAFFVHLLEAPSVVALELSATQLTPSNFAALAVRGTDAIGGIGDWALGNGTLCATLSDIEHQTFLSQRGGTLIDLGHCGYADDQWATYHEQFNLAKEQIIPVRSIRAETTETQASIIVEGEMAGVESVTTYTLALSDPETLSITTRLTRREAGERLALFGSLILHPRRALTPFVLSTHAPRYSKGFHHTDFDTENKMELLGAILPSDLHILVGPNHLEPQISYGVLSVDARILRANGKMRPLKQFAIGDENFSLLGAFAEPLLLSLGKKPGRVEFLQSLFMDLDIGDSLIFERRILVSSHADVASITNRIYQGSEITGRVENATARVHVFDAKGHPLSFVRPDREGRFAVKLPRETRAVQIQVDTAWSRQTLEREVHGTHLDLGTIPTGEPALLRLPQSQAMRLVFIGVEGTPTPVLFADNMDFRIEAKPVPSSVSGNIVSLAGIDADLDEIYLAPGTYRVLATRGPEFSATETTVFARAGRTTRLQIDPPERVVNTPGWIGADLHVHSALSFDSSLPVGHRLIEFAAQGGEVLVSSEHKVTADLTDVRDKLDLRGRLIVIPGVELTGMARTEVAPRTIGHSNVFPISAQPEQFAGGTLPHENRKLGALIGAYKALAPESVFQLNHPRLGKYDSDIAFFDHLSDGVAYDPTLALSDEPNRRLLEHRAPLGLRDLDFDAMELLSGEAMESYATVRADWFSFLLQGEVRTATANSDSHSSAQIVALPRNYIRLTQDSIGEFHREAFLEALKRGQVYGTTGPMLAVQLGSAGIGELFHGSEGTLSIRVDAAPWVPIERVQVFVDGASVEERSIHAGEELRLSLRFERDAFLTVEVLGEPGEVYRLLAPGYRPFAFTNPIFIDADGDGAWTAPLPLVP